METNVKFQIFISSPFRDLKEWRKALIEKILEHDHIPSGMEMFSAGDEDDWEVICKAIDQCDIYVVIVGARYGSVFKKSGLSFTQREFRYARDKAKKPILAFLVEGDAFIAERAQLDANKPKLEADAKLAQQERANEPKLTKFREEVKGLDKNGSRRRIVRAVNSPSDLSAEFSISLLKLLKDKKFALAGWRRFSAEVGRNPFIQSVVSKLNEFEKLSHRCVEERANLKEAMGQYFWDNLGYEFVLKHGIRNLYFESGSTIAYVSSEFGKSDTFKNHRGEWQIRTNNILSYLQFVLFEDVQVDLCPHGPPENKYGGTYGVLAKLDKPGWPAENRPLAEIQPKAIAAIRELAAQIVPSSASALILGAASGLELDQDSNFPGPHAATFVNKLVKRALLETGHPIVMFLDEEKISPAHPGGKFHVGKCHHVCDPDLSWKDVCAKFPIAICVGASSKEKLDVIVSSLAAAGLTKISHYQECGEKGRSWVTVVRNNPFDEALGKTPPTPHTPPPA